MVREFESESRKKMRGLYADQIVCYDLSNLTSSPAISQVCRFRDKGLGVRLFETLRVNDIVSYHECSVHVALSGPVEIWTLGRVKSTA